MGGRSVTEDWSFLFANERFFIIINRTARDLPARIMHFAHYAVQEELNPSKLKDILSFSLLRLTD